MEFITRKPPVTSAAADAELHRYLMGLTDDVNRALERVCGVSGERDGWSWRRLPDGVAECWRCVRCTDISFAEARGALYESGGYGGIAYPFEFDRPPLLLISVSGTEGAPCFIEQMGGKYGATEKNTGRWRFASPLSCDGSSAVVSIYARGRVKR